MQLQVIKIQKAVHDVLSPAGFKKHRTVWIRDLPEVRQVVALDRGSWGTRCWFEFGANVRKVCDDPKPRFYQLHLRWSDEQLMTKAERLAWIDLSNLERDMILPKHCIGKTVPSAISPEYRAGKFADVAHRYILPTLATVDSINKIKSLIDDPSRWKSWPYLSGDREVVKKKLHVLWD